MSVVDVALVQKGSGMKPEGCDYEGSFSVSVVEGRCRCLVCGRCGRHTGNSTQGHYWGYCAVTKKVEIFHYCCPDDCELA